MDRHDLKEKLFKIFDWRAGLFIIAFALPLLGGLDEMQQAIGGPDKSSKPQPALSVQMTLLNSPAVGQEAVVDLEVKTLADAPQIRISFQLPAELSLTGGTETIVSTMSKGETKHFQIRFIVPDDKAHEIIASAAIEFPDGSKMAKAAALTINPGQSEKPKAPPVLKKSRDNENVIEFKAQ